jgi:hypothetical protein
MNEDEMHALEPAAGDDLERTLARYARVRLDPTAAQSRRARSVVMEAAWRRRIAPGTGSTMRGEARRIPFSGWSARRVGLSLAAAVLAGLLVGSSAFAGSRAGGPLYGTRLNLETMLLPSDPGARLDAELAQAQARLAEVVEASGRSDPGAVAAALGAYERSIQDLSQANGPSADRALAAIELHRSVLESLLASAAGPSVSGLENALSRSSRVIDQLTGNGTAGAGGANGAANPGNGNGDPGNGNPGTGIGNGGADPSTGAGNGNGNPGNGGGGVEPGNGNSNDGGGTGAGNGNGNPGNGGGANATPDVAATAKPHPTPKGPTSTADPGH